MFWKLRIDTSLKLTQFQQIDLTKHFSPKDHQATANEVKAGTNGEIVQRKKPSFVQNVTTIDDGKVEPQEPTWNGNIWANNSWFQGWHKKCQKENRKMSLLKVLRIYHFSYLFCEGSQQSSIFVCTYRSSPFLSPLSVVFRLKLLQQLLRIS